jgi:ABC-type antimicrobial peptide transport system permease subunit
MASITMQSKRKEMGVRKILGASVRQVLLMLLTNFSKPIVLALTLATPLAWWIMDNWLQNFTYHVSLGLPIFVLSGILILVIAWATIAWLIVRTAAANPVEALKVE